MTALPAITDDRLIWQTWLSIYRLPVLTVADEIGTIPAISDKALSTDDLAAGLAVDARALAVHLAVLAALGFVVKQAGKWRASATARATLHPDGEGYCAPALHGVREARGLHDQMLGNLRSGGRGEGHVSAADEWERGEMPPEMAHHITTYMNAHSGSAARAVALLPQFGAVRSLLDVGGGSAIFSLQVAHAWPQLQATVMEIPIICGEADRFIAASPVADRVRTQAVNMFTESWPIGHDAHFFSNIFHDWSDATCRLLAAKSFAALAPGGTIMLHEMLLDDDGCGPLETACFSLLMLLGTKGKQYSFAELQAILESAGFVEVEASPTAQGLYSLVTARKAA